MKLLDTLTASLACGVTDRTVRRWVEAGTLTNHGTARRVRVDLDECRRVLAARRPNVR